MDLILLAIQETHFWDFLKPAIAFAETINLPLRVILLLLSLGLFIIAFLAYKRSKSTRFFFVTLAFALFVLKWIFQLFDLFVSPGYFFTNPVENVLELVIFASLFLALFKK